MQIIPAIDLRGGKCVRLRQGDYSQETVFGDDQRQALAPQALQQLQQLVRRRGVQLAQRFVQHQQSRTHRQDGGDGQSLFLPSGKRIDAPVPHVRQSGALERFVDPPVDLARIERQVLQAEGDLGLDGRGDELLVGRLQHQAG